MDVYDNWQGASSAMVTRTIFIGRDCPHVFCGGNFSQRVLLHMYKIEYLFANIMATTDESLTIGNIPIDIWACIIAFHPTSNLHFVNRTSVKILLANRYELLCRCITVVYRPVATVTYRRNHISSFISQREHYYKSDPFAQIKISMMRRTYQLPKAFGWNLYISCARTGTCASYSLYDDGKCDVSNVTYLAIKSMQDPVRDKLFAYDRSKYKILFANCKKWIFSDGYRVSDILGDDYYDKKWEPRVDSCETTRSEMAIID